MCWLSTHGVSGLLWRLIAAYNLFQILDARSDATLFEAGTWGEWRGEMRIEKQLISWRPVRVNHGRLLTECQWSQLLMYIHLPSYESKQAIY